MSEERPRRALPAETSSDVTPAPPTAKRGMPTSGWQLQSTIAPIEPPRPVLPEREWESGYVPRRSALSAVEIPMVLPRRSAASATFPDELDDSWDEDDATPATPARRGLPDSLPATPQSPAEPAPEQAAPATRRTTRLAGRTALIILMSVAVFCATFFLTRFAWKPSQTMPPNEIPGGEVTDALLAAPEDLQMAQTSTWQIIEENSGQPAQPICVPRDQPLPPSSTQRTLTAPSSAALLHRVGAYHTVAEAKDGYTGLAQAIAACSSSPAQIVSTWSVTGLADQAFASVIAVQDAVTTYHTVLTARTGNSLAIFDVAQPDTSVPAESLAASAVPALRKSCAAYSGTCPSQLAVTETLPIAVPDGGWLIASDLPRISPGTGSWMATEPTSITNEGTACENVDLASVAGPKDRSTRTYLMTHDPAMAANFGIDSMRFSFDTPAQAAQFAKTLSASLDSCASRMPTATVGKPATIPGTGAANGVVATVRTVRQSQSPTQTLDFRTAVVSAGRDVVYNVGVVAPHYDFTDEQWNRLSLRTGERILAR